MRNFIRSLLTLTLTTVVAACGGGGGHSSSGSFTDASSNNSENVHPISVNGGPFGIPNLAFTSVTVCVPNSTQCQTIDNVIVDTGSIGLRLVSSALTSISLPSQQAANGNTLVTCTEFADSSFAWGPVRRADIKLGSFTASNTPIQVIGDIVANTRPSTCGSGDSEDDLSSVVNMGGNGILGIGYFRSDCSDCDVNAGRERYYSCGMSNCIQTVAATNIQVQNPVMLFPTDNNGVIIDLPAVPSSGAASVSGSMIFGIGTRTNNSLSGKTLFSAEYGLVLTRYNGVDYWYSFFDSGSNGLFFSDNTIPACPHDPDEVSYFYCPSNTLSKSATIFGVGPNSNSISVSFNVANTSTLNGNLNAFNNLAGYMSDTFDWGLPFFYGRRVYTGFESNPQGPFTAF